MIIPSEVFELNSILTAFRSDAEIRLVGGFLRDSILGLQPSEVDLASNLQPEDLMKAFRRAGVVCLPTGLPYGTVTAILHHQPFEITTLRQDISCYGRKAKVLFTNSWEVDAARRDFTINALYLDLNNTIYDYFSGQEDLQLQKVKFIGDPLTRIEEDYLRLLRYFRFLAYFAKGNIDHGSLEAVLALKTGLQKLSIERIQKELLKLLSLPYPTRSLQLIIENQILHPFWSNKIHLYDTLSLSRDPLLNLAAIFYINHVSLELCNFKLSRLQSQKIEFLLQFDENLLQKILDPALQDRLIKQLQGEFNQEKTLDIAYFATIIYAEKMQLNLENTIHSLETKIKSLSNHLFPLKAKHLINLGLQGPKIGLTLKAGKKIWLESECNLGISELIQLLKDNKF